MEKLTFKLPMGLDRCGLGDGVWLEGDTSAGTLSVWPGVAELRWQRSRQTIKP